MMFAHERCLVSLVTDVLDNRIRDDEIKRVSDEGQMPPVAEHLGRTELDARTQTGGDSGRDAIDNGPFDDIAPGKRRRFDSD